MLQHVRGKYTAILAAAMALLLLGSACGPSAQPVGEKAQQEAQKAQASKGPALSAGNTDFPTFEALYNRLKLIRRLTGDDRRAGTA